MDVNNAERIWEDFILKVDALVTYGYSMPHDIQLKAVDTLDQQLIKWKLMLVVKADNVTCDDDCDPAGGNADYDDGMPFFPVKVESSDSSDMRSKISKKRESRKRKLQVHTHKPRKSTGGNTDDKISDVDTLENNSRETKYPVGNKHSRKRRNRSDVQLKSSCSSKKIDVKQEDHSVGKCDGSDGPACFCRQSK